MVASQKNGRAGYRGKRAARAKRGQVPGEARLQSVAFPCAGRLSSRRSPKSPEVIEQAWSLATRSSHESAEFRSWPEPSPWLSARPCCRPMFFAVVPVVPTALFMPLAQPLDAVLFVLTGASLLSLHIRSPRLRQTSAALATALATLLLAEYVFRVDLRVDAPALPRPGRPAGSRLPRAPRPAELRRLPAARRAAPRAARARRPAPALVQRGADHCRHRADARHRRPPGRRAGAVRPRARQRCGAVRCPRAPPAGDRHHGGHARGRAGAAAPERRAGHGAPPAAAAVRAGAPHPVHGRQRPGAPARLLSGPRRARRLRQRLHRDLGVGRVPLGARGAAGWRRGAGPRSGPRPTWRCATACSRRRRRRRRRSRPARSTPASCCSS